MLRIKKKTEGDMVFISGLIVYTYPRVGVYSKRTSDD